MENIEREKIRLNVVRLELTGNRAATRAKSARHERRLAPCEPPLIESTYGRILHKTAPSSERQMQCHLNKSRTADGVLNLT